MKKSAEKERLVYHKDGSLWAKGQTLQGKMTGYWEWYRKDGTRLRSGYFDRDVPVGEWTTYDRKGEVYKVTAMKPKKRKGAKRGPDATDAKSRLQSAWRCRHPLSD